MKVIDNFLSEVDFLNLNAFLFGSLISWNYTDLKDLEIPDDNLASSHFYHIFVVLRNFRLIDIAAY